MTLSQNGLELSAAATVMLTVLLIYEAILDWKEKRSMLLLFKKLSPQDQQLINTIRQTIPATSQNIINQNPATTPQKLEEAKKAGLIEKAIANNDDEPKIIWKTRIPTKEEYFST